VNNNGTIVLTERRLLVITLTGKTIDIAVSEIIGVREDKVLIAAIRSLAGITSN
jgi:hypothetical protein